MGIHAAKIVQAHKLVESVPGVSELVRVAVHRWISYLQIHGLADRLSCLNKKTLLAIESAASGDCLSTVHIVIPYCSDVLIEELKWAARHCGQHACHTA